MLDRMKTRMTIDGRRGSSEHEVRALAVVIVPLEIQTLQGFCCGA